MHPRHWKLELRDAAQGIECRLLQADGEQWGERTAWLPFGGGDAAHRELLARAGELCSPPSGSDPKQVLDAIGDTFRRVLPEAVQQVFDTWTGLPQRPLLLVEAVAAAEGAARTQAKDVVASSAFDGIGLFRRGEAGLRRLLAPATRADGSRPTQEPIVPGAPPRQGHRIDTPIAAYEPLRVLVLVGSLRDPHDLGRHGLAAIRKLRELRAKLHAQDLGSAVELRVACARGAAERVGDRWCLAQPAVESGERIAIDDLLVDEASVRYLLEHGTLQDGQAAPYQVLLTTGHSDATDDTMATALEFDFDASASATTRVAAHQIAAAARSDLRCALLLNCRSAAFAVEFLGCADHVFAIHPMLAVDTAGAISAALFDRLLDDVSPAEAARHAREQIEPDGWQLAHLTRVRTDLAFASRERQILQRHYADAYKPLNLMRLRFGSKAEFALARVQIDLSIAVHDREAMGAAGTAGVTRAMEGAGPAARSGAHRAAGHEARMPFAALLDLPYRRFVLRGEPGAGKTTTLRVCALHWPDGRFVLHVSLPRWARNTTATTVTGAALCEDVAVSAGQRIPFSRVVEQRAERGELVVLLDAYDELEKADRSKADELLAWLSVHWRRAVVVVTARMGTKLDVDPERKDGESEDATLADEAPGAGEAVAGGAADSPLRWHRATVRPMEQDEQQRLLSNWFAAARRPDPAELAARAVRELSQCGPRMQEMAGNPLLLTFLADHMLGKLPRGAVAADFEFLSRLRRHELLGLVIDAWLAGSYADRSERQTAVVEDPLREPVRGLLRRVAWEMTRRGTTELDEATLCAVLDPRTAVEDGVSHAEILRVGKWSPQSFLDVLKDWVGVLRPEHTGGGAPWRFLHRHLQEVLAAEYWWFVKLREGAVADPIRDVLKVYGEGLASARGARAAGGGEAGETGETGDAAGDLEDPETDGDAGDRDFWTEPLVLLAERLPGGDRLLLALLGAAATRAVGIRVLQAVDVVAPETLAALLATGEQAVLPEWKSGREDLPPFGYWRPRALVLELLGDRLPRGEGPFRGAQDPRRRVLEVLEQHAVRTDLDLAEVGATVHCLERAGRFWRVPGRGESPAEAARARHPEVLAAVLRVVRSPRFGKLDSSAKEKQLPEWRWCAIPAATAFRMGSSELERERPPKLDVTLAEFAMQATPVTAGQFAIFRGAARDAGSPGEADARRPVVDVCWYEALLFARWLTGQQRAAGTERLVEFGDQAWFDLPTEAEWEWGARGRTTTRYWSGDTADDLGRVGWYSGNSGWRLQPVAERPANPFGLFDVHGNCWEWCSDAYAERLPGGRQPWVSRSGAPRVVRGGCYGDVAGVCRSAFRFRNDPGDAVDFLGFRLVCVRVPPELGVGIDPRI